MFTGRMAKGLRQISIQDEEQEEDNFFNVSDGHWNKGPCPKDNQNRGY